MAEEKKPESEEKEAVQPQEAPQKGTATPAPADASEGEQEEEIEEPEDEDTKTKIPVRDLGFDVDAWQPRTEIGRKVKSGEITDIADILDKGYKIVEPEIVDILLPNLESELLLIGQSKGKFGGGGRRVFNQTQKKTPEGNKPSFSALAVVGNKDGYVGIGKGKSKDTVPSREKAIRNAKLNVFKIRRGNGSWEDNSKEPHSLPFAVEGKCGSVRIRLMPAPKGKGLVIEKECQKILGLAGIKNVWSKTSGQTQVKQNLIAACEAALRKLVDTRINEKVIKETALVEGQSAK